MTYYSWARLNEDLQEYMRREHIARMRWARNPADYRAMEEADKMHRRANKVLNEMREPAI